MALATYSDFTLTNFSMKQMNAAGADCAGKGKQTSKRFVMVNL